MVRVWRVCREQYQEAAFDGEGARRFGGRFNSVGIPVVYTSESPALAMFEILVHLDSYEQLDGRVLIPADIPDDLVEGVASLDLPPNWSDAPIPRTVQQLGDAWAESRRSVVLRVPSVVVPHSWNYVLNPVHDDFGRIAMHLPEPLSADARLIK